MTKEGKMSKHKERQFPIEIVQHLTSNKWVEGDVSGYSRELALYPQDITNCIAIDLLKEKCTAIINSAVTGKIDVRGEVA